MAETGKQQPLWRAMRDARASTDLILQHFRAEEAPIAVGRIATGLGVELAEGPGSTDSGQLQFSEERARIWTSTQEPKEQRRFTLAFLLGHVLRLPYGEYRCALGQEGRDGPPEALSFARGLLMPREILQRLIQEDHDELSLARRLGVSPQQLRLRFKELGMPPPRPAERTLTERSLAQILRLPEDDDIGYTDDFTEADGQLPFEDRTEPFGNIERRSHERVQARFEVRFSLPGQAANALRAYSKDISVGGLCLKTTRSLKVGDPLELTMVVGSETFHLRAVVAWVREGFIGVRFDRVAPDDQVRLARLVTSLRK